MNKYAITCLAWLLPLTAWAAPDNSQNYFGFLGAGLDKANFEYLETTGAGWLRPHPGPAVWEMIQTEAGGDYDWDFMDGVVTKAQNYNIDLLITIWPFASWDQVQKGEDERCQVAETDEFLPNEEAEKKGRVEYLPIYRCNPYDWAEYERWVKAMVERYDGDGKRDMPDLVLPIKHWEVMNEPDLPGSDDLDFYKDGVDEYYTLLRHTYLTVKKADPKANVLIAGAAGSATDQAGYFLDFYTTLFTDYPQTKKYFNIGNIHHISPESAGDFNVAAYRALLDVFDINKPIWVTEAGAEGLTDATEQAEAIKSKTRAAIAAGAQKIFYIHYSFGDSYDTAALKAAKKIYKKLITRWNAQ